MKTEHLKKTVLLFFGFCIILIGATNQNTFAQTSESPLSIGIKAGLASGGYSSQDYVEVGTAKNGFHLGVFADYQVMEIMSVTVELLYTRTGATDINPLYFYSDENAVFNDKIINSSITSNIVNIPVLASFTIPEIMGQVKPKIYIGGDFGYYLSSESLNTYEIISGNSVIYTKDRESLGGRLLDYDFGAIVGTGFNINANKLTYQFDIRYRLGLQDLNDTNSDFVNSSIYQNVFSVMFGIAYNL